MNRQLFTLFVIIGTLLISGCTSNLNPSDIAKTTDSVKQFLEEYPNAKIIASHMDKESLETIIDDLRIECGEQMILDSYWKVLIKDPDSNSNVTVWIEEDTMQAVCVIREGSDEAVTEPKDEEIDVTTNFTENVTDTNDTGVEDLCEGILCDDSITTCSDGETVTCENTCNLNTGRCTTCVPNCEHHESNDDDLDEEETPYCGDDTCNNEEDYDSCPEDCENPCPSSCDDDNPYTLDYCDEDTSYQCAHDLVGCQNGDDICPEDCVNSDDSDCSIISILAPEWSPTEYITSDSQYVYLGIHKSSPPAKINIYKKSDWSLVNSFSVNDEPSSALYDIEVDDNQIYIAAPTSVQIFDKSGNYVGNISLEYEPMSIAIDDENIYLGMKSPSHDIRVYDKNTLSLINSLDGHDNLIWELEVDGNYIYSGSEDKTIKIWDKSSGTLVKTLSQTNYVNNLRIDDNYIYSLDAKMQDDTDRIRIWDKSDFESERIIPLGWGRWIGMQVDTNYIYVGYAGSDKNIIYVFRKLDGSPHKEFYGNLIGGGAVPIGIDSQFIYVEGDCPSDYCIQVWKK